MFSSKFNFGPVAILFLEAVVMATCTYLVREDMMIECVCPSSGRGSLEAVGWNECHALHRAVAEGNIPVMQLLLRRGVNVNGMDMMR